jgi:hypothetical protein
MQTYNNFTDALEANQQEFYDAVSTFLRAEVGEIVESPIADVYVTIGQDKVCLADLFCSIPFVQDSAYATMKRLYPLFSMKLSYLVDMLKDMMEDAMKNNIDAKFTNELLIKIYSTCFLLIFIDTDHYQTLI